MAVTDIDKTLAFSRAIHEFQDVEPLLNFLISRFISTLEAERGFLILFENDTRVFRFAQTFEKEVIKNPENEVSNSLVDEAVRRERAVLVAAALDDPHFSESKSIHRLELLSVLCAPLLTSHSGVLGVIYLDNRSEIGRFSESDCAMLEVLAHHAGAALEAAILMEKVSSAEADETELFKSLPQQINERFRQSLTEVAGMVQACQWMHSNGAASSTKEIYGALKRYLELSDAVRSLWYAARKAQFQPIQLRVLLENSLNLIPGLADRDVRLRIDEQIWIEGSANDLQRAVKEILMNAWQATRGQQHRHVEIEGTISAHTASVTVVDNGAGFNEESRRRAAEPFFTTKRLANGLGLSIATAIIEAHGGTASWNSVGGRTELHIELANAFTKNAGEVVPSDRRVAKILLVDDSTEASRVLIQTLARHGHDVSHVISTGDAIPTLTDKHWDILLVDGGFGLSELQELIQRAKAVNSPAAVVLLTSWSEWSQTTELSLADMAVSKPIQLRYLPRVIQQALEKRWPVS